MRTIILIILAFGLNACIPDIQGDTDNSIDNSTNYGSGTVLVCTDAVCEIAEVGSDVDAIVGKYSADYTQTECEAAGFFYCTIENMCLDMELDTGTCG